MNDALKSLLTQTAEAATKAERERLQPRLDIVLDFVERWNKQDKEKEVAEAAASLTIKDTKL